MKQSFSIKARRKSFLFAFNGLKQLVRSEHNTWIHAVITLLVLAASFILRIDRFEWLIIIMAIAFVWVAEIFNTCLEKAMDFISTEYHPAIGIIKDMASAAVLIASISAVICGCIIFLPKVF